MNFPVMVNSRYLQSALCCAIIALLYSLYPLLYVKADAKLDSEFESLKKKYKRGRIYITNSRICDLDNAFSFKRTSILQNAASYKGAIEMFMAFIRESKSANQEIMIIQIDFNPVGFNYFTQFDRNTSPQTKDWGADDIKKIACWIDRVISKEQDLGALYDLLESDNISLASAWAEITNTSSYIEQSPSKMAAAIALFADDVHNRTLELDSLSSTNPALLTDIVQTAFKVDSIVREYGYTGITDASIHRKFVAINCDTCKGQQDPAIIDHQDFSMFKDIEAITLTRDPLSP